MNKEEAQKVLKEAQDHNTAIERATLVIADCTAILNQLSENPEIKGTLTLNSSIDLKVGGLPDNKYTDFSPEFIFRGDYLERYMDFLNSRIEDYRTIIREAEEALKLLSERYLEAESVMLNIAQYERMYDNAANILGSIQKVLNVVTGSPTTLQGDLIFGNQIKVRLDPVPNRDYHNFIPPEVIIDDNFAYRYKEYLEELMRPHKEQLELAREQIKAWTYDHSYKV